MGRATAEKELLQTIRSALNRTELSTNVTQRPEPWLWRVLAGLSCGIRGGKSGTGLGLHPII